MDLEPARQMTRTVLVLSPHTDDGQLGCGGSIAKYLETGANVYYAVFSTCDESVPEGWPSDTLKQEMYSATRELGIRSEHLLVFEYPVRRFSERRQDILEDMVRIQRELNPDLVFLPSVSDIHQDHGLIAAEGPRAFKGTTLLGYEEPWNTMQFHTQAFVKLEQRHVDRKVAAFLKNESQGFRPYASEEFLRGWSRTRGASVGASAAEAFEVVRWVLE